MTSLLARRYNPTSLTHSGFWPGEVAPWIKFEGWFFQCKSSLDFNQFREGAITILSNRAFQESVTRILKLRGCPMV